MLFKLPNPGVEQEQKETIQTLENEHLQLKETIKELQARRAGRHILTFRRSHGTMGDTW